ncbi:MAG: cytochrome P460 family protein [Deltaproteobacteria bacterium]|nr:cytochrome P460 family protein [Deltaproteobacteria bacterium]
MPSPTRLAAAALALALAAPLAARAGGKEVALPRDFRTWTHVRSMVVTDPDEGMYGFHNVYANKAALRTLRGQARSYADGAVFVVSIFEVKQEKGQVVAGAKQRDVVQVKDASATETGGWRFASFDPSGKRTAVDVSTCAACHAQASGGDHVFTRFAE